MIEIQDSLAYVTLDEQNLIKRLYRRKPESAVYFKNGVKIGYHWTFDKKTLGKLKLTAK